MTVHRHTRRKGQVGLIYVAGANMLQHLLQRVTIGWPAYAGLRLAQCRSGRIGQQGGDVIGRNPRALFKAGKPAERPAIGPGVCLVRQLRFDGVACFIGDVTGGMRTLGMPAADLVQ